MRFADIDTIKKFVNGVDRGAPVKYFAKEVGISPQAINYHLGHLEFYRQAIDDEVALPKLPDYMLYPVFITGMPRSGTSLLTYLMRCFDGVNVLDSEEKNPIVLTWDNLPQDKINVAKQPFGYFESFWKYKYMDIVKKRIRIISLVRDPRDVLVSKHKADESKYWVEPKIVKRCAREHLSNISNWYLLPLKYEDLAMQPNNVMKKISRFIGRPYSRDFKSFYKHVDESTSMAKALNGPRPIVPDSIGNWRKEEHRQRIEEVLDDELKDLIVQLGYKL